MPLKNGWDLTSSAPFVPILFSAEAISFLIRFSDSGDSETSEGIEKFFFHWTIFLHVSAGLSLKNGGYPTFFTNNFYKHFKKDYP